VGVISMHLKDHKEKQRVRVFEAVRQKKKMYEMYSSHDDEMSRMKC